MPLDFVPYQPRGDDEDDEEESLCKDCRMIGWGAIISCGLSEDYNQGEIDTSMHTGLSSFGNLCISAAHCRFCNVICNRLIQKMGFVAPHAERASVELAPVSLARAIPWIEVSLECYDSILKCYISIKTGKSHR